MKTAVTLLILLAFAASPMRAQEEFAKTIYAEIENSARREYGAMVASIMRSSAQQPPKDEAEQTRRAALIEDEIDRVKSFVYNRAAAFAFCAGEADLARGPGASPLRSDRNLILSTCVELKFEQMRKFANVSSYVRMFFPERLEPCGDRARLAEREKVLPAFDFLEMKEPRLYDFERYSECVMTPP